MLRKMMISAVLMTSFLTAAVPVQASPSLSNDDVATLSKAGLGEDAIISAIQSQDASFDLSVPALLKLKQDGVTPNVLRAMITAMNKKGATAATSSQSKAGATDDHTNQAPASQDPVAPTSKKKSWLKAVAAVGDVAGRALSSAGVNFAGGAGMAGGSFKSGFLSGLSGLANQQSNGYGMANQVGPNGAAANFAEAPAQAQGSPYYYTAQDGNVISAGNPAAQGSRQSAGSWSATPDSATS
ncbi:MAG TPA: hypothetical protein VEF05_06270, partial [Terriglobales bacterium]|nr:hypothetical protein [Terriglobales bacterium]